MKEIIGAGETDRDKLIDMVISAKKCSVVRGEMERLAESFPICVRANRKMTKRFKQ